MKVIQSYLQDHAVAIFWALVVVCVLLWINHLVRAKCSGSPSGPKAYAVSGAPGFTCGCARGGCRDFEPAEAYEETEVHEGFYAGDPSKPFPTYSVSDAYMGSSLDISDEFNTFDKPIMGTQFDVPTVKYVKPGDTTPVSIPDTLQFGTWTSTKNNDAVRKQSMTKLDYVFTRRIHGAKNACVVYFVPKGKGILSDAAAMQAIKATLKKGIEAMQDKIYTVTNGHFALRKVYVAVCEVDVAGKYMSIKTEKPYNFASRALLYSNQGALTAMIQRVSSKLAWNDTDIFTYIMTGTTKDFSAGMLASNGGQGTQGTSASSTPQRMWIKSEFFGKSNILTHELLHNLGLGAHATNDATSIMTLGEGGGIGTRLNSLFTYQLGCMNKVTYVSIHNLSSSITVNASDLPDARDACVILYVPVFCTDRRSNGASHSDWLPQPVGSISRRGNTQIEIYLSTDTHVNTSGFTSITAGESKTLTATYIPPLSNFNPSLASEAVLAKTLGLPPRPTSISFKVQVNSDYSVTITGA